MFLLWPEGIRHENVLLFITDTASDMIKEAKSIKDFCSRIVQMTCLVHGPHRVAEHTSPYFPQEDSLVSNIKMKFLIENKLFKSQNSCKLSPESVKM